MPQDRTALEYFNGFGGFAQDGTEYEILLEDGRRPPAPWINVIANPDFGFTVSESGAGHTWAFNSRENKITPWSNDPVSDPAGEAVYVRDNMTGRLMSPTPLGAPRGGAYRVRHGFGYTVFHHAEGGLAQQLTLFVPREDRVKLWLLELENTAGRELDLTLIYFAQWVLGFSAERSGPYLVTSYSNSQESLVAENVYEQAWREYRAFLFSSERVRSYTGDRQAFLDLFEPGTTAFETGGGLSNQTGVGLDACGALEVGLRLKPGERRTLVFGLGYAREEEIPGLIRHYRDGGRAGAALEAVRDFWRQTLGTVQVQSRDRPMDILLNGWLIYQTLSCRMWARTAFYQNGGAYGYRDQLQDALALVHCRPDLLRDQLLISASRQFPEGDVQHWWHPPEGLGVRTRITDDLLWMPYAAAAYIAASGDHGILDEERPYLEGPALPPDQHSMMFVPQVSSRQASLYEHCKAAIERVGYGERGLPLMGGGDWNDGMDRVGIEGRGESVWLGWFLFAVLAGFIPLAQRQGDLAYADQLRTRLAALRDSLEASAWDGQWYLRAFYDDGSKLGSHENQECRIDSISQSWSILSGAGSPERARQAFESAWEHLVLREEGVSLLLTPPFDKKEKDPGYIKNYHPGIRENGGQYTHAAIWLACAATRLEDSGRAWQLFRMLNPIRHALDEEQARHYEREPYVVCADLSYQAPITGRGGWSWYTGSAGWLYQGLLTYFLGLRKEGESLVLSSCVPRDFGDFTIRYRYHSSLYVIEVRFVEDSAAPREDTRIGLRDDGQEHHIVVETGCAGRGL